MTRERLCRRLVELWHQQARAIETRKIQVLLWYHYRRIESLHRKLRDM